MNRIINHSSEIYETEGWRERLGTPEDGDTSLTEEQLRFWSTPKLEDLWRYAQAVHEKTLALLDSITPEELFEIPQPDHSQISQMTVSAMLAHLITEIALHVGQIDYLRGVHRGLKRMNWQ